MKKIIALLIVIGIGYGIYYFVSDYYEFRDAWKIEITNDSVNIRELSSATSNLLETAYSGEVYVVKEIYEEDLKFIWYKVELNDNEYGWIASAREVPYVEEINNPNKVSQEDYVIDYARPVIKYEEDTYNVYDVNNIKYDHLIIEEDSEYTVKHFVYLEENPTDRPGPQYWIEYIVTDENNNTSSKIQRIAFEINPSVDEVKLFEELD